MLLSGLEGFEKQWSNLMRCPLSFQWIFWGGIKWVLVFNAISKEIKDLKNITTRKSNIHQMYVLLWRNEEWSTRIQIDETVTNNKTRYCIKTSMLATHGLVEDWFGTTYSIEFHFSFISQLCTLFHTAWFTINFVVNNIVGLKSEKKAEVWSKPLVAELLSVNWSL